MFFKIITMNKTLCIHKQFNFFNFKTIIFYIIVVIYYNNCSIILATGGVDFIKILIYHRRNLDSFYVGAKIIFVANEYNIRTLDTSVLCASEQPAINYNIIFKLVGAMPSLIFSRGAVTPIRPL